MENELQILRHTMDIMDIIIHIVIVFQMFQDIFITHSILREQMQMERLQQILIMM